ncbi:MAG: MBL fold metallo-hydrolase [Saprospiraceae bacterium]
MHVKFWGSRGSMPSSISSSSIKSKLKFALSSAIEKGIRSPEEIDDFIDSLPFGVKSTYGNNTPCIEISGGSEILICDAGTGLKDLGRNLIQNNSPHQNVINILMSHVHWDHIQGFPFFIPAYMQGYIIKIWGCHPDLEKAFVNQQEPPFFPVQLKNMGANISFHTLEPDQKLNIGGVDIAMIEQPHPGKSYGYCFEKEAKKIVYSTDIEISGDEDVRQTFSNFYKNADVLIVDGQFNLADHLYSKQDWGHSSNLVAIEMAVHAGAQKLCLFHSDHLLDDEKLDKFYTESLRYLKIFDSESKLKIYLAYDGLVL